MAVTTTSVTCQVFPGFLGGTFLPVRMPKITKTSTSPLAVVSYKTLANQIERLSGQLSKAGLKPGDCVAIILPNSLEFLVIFLALTRARLVAAPLNPAYKPDETRFFIKNAQAKAVVAE